jgi:hypothetical protein
MLTQTDQDLVKNIFEYSRDLLEVDLLGMNDNSNLIKACKEYLILNGCKVEDPIQYLINIKKQDDLINLFNLLLSRNHPEWMSKKEITNKDKAIAKYFVESRMSTGINKQRALEECAAIIYTLFEHEDEFHFDKSLSFGIFGQKKMGWITDFALAIMNRNIERANREEYEKLLEEFEHSQYKNETFGLTDDEINNILQTKEGGF